MPAIAEQKPSGIAIERADHTAHIFIVTGRAAIAIRAGSSIGGTAYADDTPVNLPELVPGTDYAITLDEGTPVARACMDGVPEDAIGGFHFAPGGNAAARAGGDDNPAINPFSCWDPGFRPACPDPRGMALVDMAGGKRFWADIYLLGVDHGHNGTSTCRATIADGRDLPMKPDGSGKTDRLDYATAVSIYARHGKQLLGAEEFFAAAHGVMERCAREEEPTVTGSLDDEARRFVSRHGLFDATGTMWQWGTDGDPDNPRPSIFGGSWFDGARAGSRFAYLAYWPGVSYEALSARGRSGHMNPV